MSKSSELDKKVKRYILDNVDSSGYGMEPESDAQRIQFLKETFQSEMGWLIEREGRQEALKQWFQGLPSACTVAFQNYEVLELAKTWGSLPENPTERQEDKILENWFNLVAAKTCQLFDGYRIPNH